LHGQLVLGQTLYYRKNILFSSADVKRNLLQEEHNMKRNTSFALLLCISVLSLAVITSCSSSPLSTVYRDPSVPWEEQSLLLTDDISNICGIDDNMSPRPYAIRTGEIGVIPAGPHTIHVIVDDGESLTPYPGIALTRDFLSGERYVVSSVAPGELSGGAASVKILTVDEYKIEWEISGPFRNSPTRIREQYFQQTVLDKFAEAAALLSGSGN
jgi:hypothetical protein